MSFHTTPWPDDEEEILRSLAAAGKSAPEIARILQKTKNAIIGYIYRRQDTPNQIIWPRTKITSKIKYKTYNKLSETALDIKGCRWLNDEKQPNFNNYCGAPIHHISGTKHQESYCEKHRAIVWKEAHK